MLTEIDARKIGIKACMDKIGYDFCIQNQDKAATAYGKDGINMFCFVGIDNNPNQTLDADTLTLSSIKGFSYSASCNVNMENGDIEYLDISA